MPAKKTTKHTAGYNYEKVKYIIGKTQVLLMFTLFPIIVHNKLNDLLKTRYTTFLIISFGCFFAMIVNEIIRFIKDKKIEFKLTYIECIASVLIISAMISYFISDYKNYTQDGIGARYVGAKFMIAIACMFITVGRCYVLEKKDMLVICIVSIFLNLLAVLNYCDIDVFGFFTAVSNEQKSIFTSTFGNVDIYGVYAVITACISTILFVDNDKYKIKNTIFLLAAVLSYMGIFSSGSEAAVISALILLAVTVLCIKYGYANFTKYMLLLELFYLSAWLILRLRSLTPDIWREDSTLINFISGNLNVAVITGIILVIWLAVTLLKSRIKEIISCEVFTKIKKGWSAVLISVVVISGILVVYYTITGNSDGELAYYLCINEKWGNNRGYIWFNILDGMKNVPFINKIFGVGHGTISCIISDYANSHWNLINGALIDNAHNISLHFFATMGLLGLLVYWSMIVSTFVCYIKNYNKMSDENKMMYTALIAVVLITFLQGCLCILDVVVFPIVICSVAMACTCKNKKNPKISA